MTARHLLLTALLGLPLLAAAQDTTDPGAPPLPELQPVPPGQPPLPELEPVPAPVSGAPGRPGTPSPAALPGLPGVSANLFVPRTVTGKVNLTLTLRSARTTPVNLALRRDNEQHCASAPLVRVLRVGTREVVYPEPGAQPRICTQDMDSKTLAARGNVMYTRELALPAGEYMIESWLSGFADNQQVKVPATPMRVTVK